MRRFIASWIVLFCLLTGNQANACFNPPDYLDSEFGSEGIILGNISDEANKIFIGRFRIKNSEDGISFKPKKRIKPRKIFSSKKDVNLNFLNVPKNKIYLYDGKDEQEFSSFSELKNFITQMRPSINLDNVVYGSGGPIAGIGHGTDCERFFLAYLDQDYPIYLNDKNRVLASFPIKSNSNDFFKGAATLFAID